MDEIVSQLSSKIKSHIHSSFKLCSEAHGMKKFSKEIITIIFMP